MEALKKLPIGIQQFEKLRKDNYLYLDKTDLVYQLAKTGCYYFLSRPRRFGKSLLLSTLHAYFEGKKELFDGLAIADLEKDWITYPVFHLDLNLVEYSSVDSLGKILNDNLCNWENMYGSRESETTFGLRFSGVIRRAYEKTGQRVVILVDEYDKPILQTIDNDEIQNAYRSTLKSFYGVLKSMDGYIQFALLTGVTKLGKVSVFSDLNNLKDISMREDYASICGITDEELDSVFVPYLERLSENLGCPVTEVREELRKRYDGYHFRANATAMYNPFSVLNTFDSNEFGSYWFETGTPSYLVYLLKKHDYELESVDGIKVGEKTLIGIDASLSDPIPVIYQSGYLTIKSYDRNDRLYTLGFPNEEVAEGFIDFLLPYYTNIKPTQTEFFIVEFAKDIRAGNVDAFMQRLKSMFAGTEYDLILNMENHYHNAMYLIFRLMGMRVKSEYKTSHGRMDMTLETADSFYVFEFKLDGTAEQALAQINEKDYLLPFSFSGKRLVKIGVNFSSTTRTIDRWIVQ